MFLRLLLSDLLSRAQSWYNAVNTVRKATVIPDWKATPNVCRQELCVIVLLQSLCVSQGSRQSYCPALSCVINIRGLWAQRRHFTCLHLKAPEHFITTLRVSQWLSITITYVLKQNKRSSPIIKLYEYGSKQHQTMLVVSCDRGKLCSKGSREKEMKGLHQSSDLSSVGQLKCLKVVNNWLGA